MDVFGRDALIGDFRLSDHGLMLVTFNYEDGYELGANMTTNESFLGISPVPKYLGSKYDGKLMPKITVIQNWLATNKHNFTVNEIREIVSRLTGYQGYKKMYLCKDDFIENVYYNVRLSNPQYELCGGEVIGISFDAECDSQFGWVDDEYETTTNSSNQIIKVNNNSDDRYGYQLPIIEVTSDSAITSFTITNITDNNRNTIVNQISANETVTINSQLNKITSNLGTVYSEIFNYKFPRLVCGENYLQISHPIDIKVTMKLPRKVGML